MMMPRELYRSDVGAPGANRRRQHKPVRDRGKIFNDALLRAVGHKEALPEVKASLTADEGDTLEIVEVRTATWRGIPARSQATRRGTTVQSGVRTAGAVETAFALPRQCPGRSWTR